MTVTKIGRKYFWAAETDADGQPLEWTKTKFYLSDWKQVSDYTATHRLYADPQAWEDEREESELCKEIATAFEYGLNRNRLPLTSLRLIAAQVRANA